ncbi:MAG: putative glycoside hydrolase [Desulfomonilia bacterium]|jgi:hypothetical protein|uniref:LysM domain-containing protein n=1 Tax=anaerobic digester metagenome TaxID=1263854 RepID=A0A485M1F5_9ZZZZ|nr:putative glycoside hydrolase [Pseudomonadota bacterium]HPD20612.1 putative glycoside hydrolase [Deltaproteobacteria bacterium]HPX17341.1 putative glycoside hydrolase [Deltaproteobacteria bacterium]HRS55466.1 putative glycoside hydrolase [Desulfomonilia bacterium]HRV35121.1 putative glycoside hydrolase [Desulfomonilia bacterium]
MRRSCFFLFLCSVLFMGAASPDEATYTVRSGDTLSSIAAAYMPYTAAYTRKELIANIKAINKIEGPLSIGQSLSIPVAWKEPLKARTVTRPRDFPAKGLYMNPSSAGTRFIFDSAERLKNLGGNTIVFDAKDDLGAITYPSPIRRAYCPEEKYYPNIEELPKLVEFLHRMGIHVAARVVVFHDPIMSRNRPEWCINREKNWLDPANPDVQKYILTVIEELVENGVDEIQLDYIRYHADGRTDTGVEGVSRTDVIASFLEKVYAITKPRGVLLSVDMFGIVIWQRDVDVLVVGQDIAKMKHHVDIISPMLYPSHFSPGFDGVKNPADDPYRFIHNGIKRMKELVGDEVVIRPWLQSFPLRVTTGFDARYIRTQIEAARDAGGTGWLLWSPGNHYNDAYRAMQDMMKPENPPDVLEANRDHLKEETALTAPGAMAAPEPAPGPSPAVHPASGPAPAPASEPEPAPDHPADPANTPEPLHKLSPEPAPATSPARLDAQPPEPLETSRQQLKDIQSSGNERMPTPGLDGPPRG